MEPDYRYTDYPLNEPGIRLIEDPVEDLIDVEQNDYLEWLSRYLATLPQEPTPEQAGLCHVLRQKRPEQGIQMLASDLGIASALDESFDDHDDPLGERFIWPHPVVPPVDLGYRVALAIILDPVQEQQARCDLLRLFFGVYFDYANK